MCVSFYFVCCSLFFFFQAEDGIRDLVRSRGLGDVYKRQLSDIAKSNDISLPDGERLDGDPSAQLQLDQMLQACLLYTSDAADDLLCVDLGGRRIITKNNPR